MEVDAVIAFILMLATMRHRDLVLVDGRDWRVVERRPWRWRQ